jgi:hypothetical protein
MNEPQIVVKTQAFLRHQMVGQLRVNQLYTDADHRLTVFSQLRPFQRFRLDMGDFALHPDLVGQFSDGETIFAVEAKGDVDHRQLLTGLAQAQMYQTAFHQTFFATDAAVLGKSLISFARSRNIGVISVSDSVEMLYCPETRMPQRDAYQFVVRQMDTVVQLATNATYHFNIPTHYLAWAIALDPGITYHQSSLHEYLQGYPMPKEWRSALSGAQKLGLVRIQGDMVSLTAVGAAVKEMLPNNLQEWANVHARVGRRGGGIPLVRHHSHIAAVLRLLLLGDPMVKLIIAGLERFPDRLTTFAGLAKMCNTLDHARAPIFFLRPNSLERLSDERGQIDWDRAQGEDYRSKMFHQYKSILKHAGILSARRLGGSTAKRYDPTKDIWELR